MFKLPLAREIAAQAIAKRALSRKLFPSRKLYTRPAIKPSSAPKLSYVSGDELLTVKFHADNAEYTLYSISLDKGQAET